MLLPHYHLLQFPSVEQNLISGVEAYKVLWKGMRKPLCYPDFFLSDRKKIIPKSISFPLTYFFPLPLNNDFINCFHYWSNFLGLSCRERAST